MWNFSPLIAQALTLGSATTLMLASSSTLAASRSSSMFSVFPSFSGSSCWALAAQIEPGTYHFLDSSDSLSSFFRKKSTSRCLCSPSLSLNLFPVCMHWWVWSKYSASITNSCLEFAIRPPRNEALKPTSAGFSSSLFLFLAEAPPFRAGCGALARGFSSSSSSLLSKLVVGSGAFL